MGWLEILVVYACYVVTLFAVLFYAFELLQSESAIQAFAYNDMNASHLPD